MSISQKLVLLAICILQIGCSTNFSTLGPEGSATTTIYEIPELHAFQIASTAITTTLPGRPIADVDGPVHGYSTEFWLYLDSYTQQVLVFPASGIDQKGRKVNGFYFEVSGAGSSFVQGKIKNTELFERVQAYAERTGKGVSVISVERRTYEGIEWQYNVVKKKANFESVDSHQGLRDTASGRLEQLKALRDKNLISETDFEVKKKQILDGL